MKTVGELIDALNEYPREAHLVSLVLDFSGMELTLTNEVEVRGFLDTDFIDHWGHVYVGGRNTTKKQKRGTIRVDK